MGRFVDIYKAVYNSQQYREEREEWEREREIDVRSNYVMRISSENVKEELKVLDLNKASGG